MNTDFMVKDYEEKLAAARADVPDVAGLRKLPRPLTFTFFKIGKSLFVWLPFDRTPDDGISSIACDTAPKNAPGRYHHVSPLK